MYGGKLVYQNMLAKGTVLYGKSYLILDSTDIAMSSIVSNDFTNVGNKITIDFISGTHFSLDFSIKDLKNSCDISYGGNVLGKVQIVPETKKLHFQNLKTSGSITIEKIWIPYA